LKPVGGKFGNEIYSFPSLPYLYIRKNNENNVAPGYVYTVCCPFRAQGTMWASVTQGDAIGLGYSGLSARGVAMKNVCYNIKCPP
jgi:hypothetical protein